MAKKKKNAGRGSIRKLRMRKVGAGGTGWMRARRVKIVKRRGHPAQVLIERPRKRARK